MFGGDLTSVWAKVHKLTLHGGFSRPNRDGTIGRGGCTFCVMSPLAEAQQHHLRLPSSLRIRRIW